MGETSIEWTDRTWNPIRGCTRVSPGCGGPGTHGGCYAEKIAARFSGPGMAYEGLAGIRGGKPRWTGKLSFGHDLEAPLRWRKPQRIFVNSMSDLFHEALSVSEIATVFGISVAAHHLRGHILQKLTKRSARMREVLNSGAFWDQVNAEASMHVLDGTDPLSRRSNDARTTLGEYGPDAPPPGIWLGVSTEDQTRADERVPDLLATPAAVRFVSAEPLLGPIDFTRITLPGVRDPFDALHGSTWSTLRTGQRFFATSGKPRLDWIIVGGESGLNARPVDRRAVRSIEHQCRVSGTAFFFKQWGEWVGGEWSDDGDCARFTPANGEPAPDLSAHVRWQSRVHWFNKASAPSGPGAIRVGKKAAGRLLDGVEHNGMPEVRHAG